MSLQRLVILAIVLLIAPFAARADMSACSSAWAKDNIDEQLELYTRCIQNGDMTRGNLGGAFTNRGVIYMRKGEIDLALSDFTKAIEYSPRFGVAYYNRANIYLQRGEVDAAFVDLEAATKRAPSRTRALAHADRGFVRLSQGDCAAALSDFDAAIRLAPKFAAAHSAKAWVLATCPDGEHRNGAQALAAAKKALSLHDHWRGHDSLAAAYAELGQFDESVNAMRIAQEKAGDGGGQWKPDLEARMALHTARKPHREPPSSDQKPNAWLVNRY
jgi:tetratricopeptide (TPR) repeat protein